MGRRAGLTLTLVAVLAVTLYPSGDASRTDFLCLLCGRRGLADAVLNAALFLPIGALLWPWKRSLLAALLVAFLLSAGIESAQLLIPGRHSTLGDLASNVLGAGLGALAAGTAGRWLRPGFRLSVVLGSCAVAAAVGVIGASAYLLGRSYPDSTYFGQWTPRLGHLAWYRGRVLELEIGGLPIPPGRLARSDSVRALLEAGADLWVRGVAGPPTDRLGSLASIYDDEQREIVLVGPDGVDLVYRPRTRATAARLDQPDIRLRGAFAGVQPGQPLRVRVETQGASHCLALNDRRRCGLGFRAGQGWALLYYSDSLPAGFVALAGLAWLALLSAPAGYWMPGIRTLAAGGLSMAAALYGITLAAPGLLGAAPWEILALGIGLAVGRFARGSGDRWLRAGGRRSRPARAGL